MSCCSARLDGAGQCQLALAGKDRMNRRGNRIVRQKRKKDKKQDRQDTSLATVIGAVYQGGGVCIVPFDVLSIASIHKNKNKGRTRGRDRTVRHRAN